MTGRSTQLLDLLKNRITLERIPFSERGSRLLLFRSDNHFTIRMAERWFKIDTDLVGYRNRPPIIDAWHLTDGEGMPLSFEVTTYPHRIDCATSIGIFTLAFADPETLLLILPHARCGVSFAARLDRAQTDRRGGVMHLTGDIRRNVAYTSTARIVRNEVTSPGLAQQVVHLSLEASPGRDGFLLNVTPRLGFNRHVPESGQTIEDSAASWNAWFEAAPQVDERYRRQYYYAWWIMRAGLISSRFYTTREAMTPSKIRYVGVWQWDAYFHALAYRHVDARLAADQVRILLDHQREDGMIPDAVHDEGTVTRLSLPVEADVTKPPLLGWAAWKLYQTTGDREFLDEIYEPIVRWNEWWFAKNDLDGDGLCEYTHPYSSGLDDSPLWDRGMPVTAPDLNTYLCLQQEALARIAQVLGEDDDARRWEDRAARSARLMVERLWDDSAGYFWAYHQDQRIDVRTPFNLLPLITGRLPAQLADRAVGHLTNEKQFWTAHPVPTVAIDDPHFDPLQMWRGPTWINVNYLFIDGLERCGYRDLARDLRDRTLDMVNRGDDIYEYYHPLTGSGDPEAASIYGWSAALFIDLAIQATRYAGGGRLADA